jgi:bifunctional non-homologous end joining protein LigD
MKKLRFVVHKHDATQLHYDFRLEIGGVMPSWAVPKGPTLDNTKKRLAMMTTDHDLEYRKFEGILPEGQYGAGPVMIWDEGTYIPEHEVRKGVREEVHGEGGEKVMEDGLKKGEIKFFLEGKKLHGSFALVKTRGFGPKNAWLLIKHKDEYVKKDYDANKYDFSAKSGKSIKEIEENS